MLVLEIGLKKKDYGIANNILEFQNYKNSLKIHNV